MNHTYRQPLNNVATIIMGQSPSSDTYNKIGKGLPFFQGKTDFGDIYPTATTWCTEPKKIAKEDDILISVRAPVGPTNLANSRCCIGRGLAAIRPINKIIDRDYLWYYLRFAKTTLEEKGQGSTFESISSDDLNALDIPIPAIGDQCHIAARLKAQLAEVEKARQAAALQLQDAEALHAAVLKETFIGKDSKSWLRMQLGDVGEVVAGITLGRKTNGKATRSIPYLRVANVKDGHLDLSDVNTIEATDAEIKRLLLQPGDILLTEGGDPDKLGRGTFWNNELEECIHQNHIFRVRFPRESYLPEFIAAQIGSSYGKDYFFARAKKTTGIATINQQVLKGFPVLSPPLNIQRDIMAVLNSKLIEIKKMTKSSTRQLQDINTLPQKILARAFGGSS